MISGIATVQNGYGIHCRPSALISRAAAEFTAVTVTVVSGEGEQADPSNVLQLISLGLHQGDIVTIEVAGEAEQEILNEMIRMFEHHYDFER